MTLIWVAGAIAFTVPRPSIEKAPTPTFLPPVRDAGSGVSAQPEPLSQRLQPLVPFLALQEGTAGMVVVGGNHQILVQTDAHRPFVLASVAKLYIMTAYMSLVASENRDLTPDEFDLLSDMIQASDNDTASLLWDRIGRSAGLQRYLASRQLPPIEPAADDASWGDMQADAVSVASLLTGLYENRLLPPDMTATALHLMSHIIDSQAWGLGVVSEDDMVQKDGDSRVYLKNGWYPEENGWVVNSAGVIARGSEHYVMVVLTDGQPSFRAGVELIETATAFASDRLP